VGFLRSTSLRPDQVLGRRFDEFGNEVAEAVLSVEPTGQWIYDDSVEVITAGSGQVTLMRALRTHKENDFSPPQTAGSRSGKEAPARSPASGRTM
jgi:hypothetical protein